MNEITYIEEVVLAQGSLQLMEVRQVELELRDGDDLLHHGLGRELSEEGHVDELDL